MKTPAAHRALDALLEQCADARQAQWIDQLAADWPADESLLLHLVRFAVQADPLPQFAAAGLLKRHLAAGAAFPTVVTTPLLAELLPVAARWEARLQLLQMLPALDFPADQAEALHAFLRRLLSAERNRFVRAWVYTGLHRLADLHPVYRSEVAARLAQAAQEEAASVRARLRRLPGWRVTKDVRF